MLAERPLFLLGFMGSGKTYLGRQLAALLHRPFVDLDERLEQQEGCSISELFSRDGEALFREKERRCLQAIPLFNQVIATGGGTPCHADNMQYMSRCGHTVYLQVDPEVLYERLLPQTANRPLLKGLSGEALRRFIHCTLQERIPFYQQAHTIACADRLTATQLLRLLQDAA
ncbi:MAG: AAA family ATPase [Chitinophagales bacterium]|nr:AAA family ATPase [Chitinophagales bacterium]